MPVVLHPKKKLKKSSKSVSSVYLDTQERHSIGPGGWRGPVCPSDLAHVGHHVVGVGAHDGHPLGAVLHFHVG